MAMWVKFGRNGAPKGYLNGRKKTWKRMVSKARRRWAKRTTDTKQAEIRTN